VRICAKSLETIDSFHYAEHPLRIEGHRSPSEQRTSQKVKGFGRRPFARVGRAPGPALESLPRRKTAGGPFGERGYGDLRIADG
jgi:hypothetical protein